MRQSNREIKDGAPKQKATTTTTAPFRFIINILFKLRCYCCHDEKNCNFHKGQLGDFQVSRASSEIAFFDAFCAK